MFPHGSEPRGRRVWRRSATYDRTRPPHIESQGGLCGYSRFSVRFLLASQPDRSQGEPREWKWMENWWTNNNRCPGERVETLTRGKFITGACLASTFVCRPGTRDLPSINTTAWCKKVSRLILMISFEFELKYSDNIFDGFSIREGAIGWKMCIFAEYIFIRNIISRDNIQDVTQWC